MISNLSSAQLRRAAEIKDKVETLQSELTRILNGIVSAKRVGRPPGSGRKGKRTMSAAGRAKIAAAARLRWKKAKASGRNRL